MKPFVTGQVPDVPNWEMPATAQAVATSICAVVAVAAIVAALVAWKRRGTPIYLVLLTGATLASINEPFTNVLGGVKHPSIGQWEIFSTFDRPIPAWAVLGYLVFFGAVPWVVLEFVRNAADPRRRFLMAVGIIFVANLLLEVPILAAGMYEYYGVQPFQFFHSLPLHWLIINALGVGSTVVVLYNWQVWCKGRRMLAVLLLPAMTQYAATCIAIPTFALYNTNANELWKWVGSATTMVIGAFAINGISKLIPSALPDPRTPGQLLSGHRELVEAPQSLASGRRA